MKYRVLVLLSIASWAASGCHRDDRPGRRRAAPLVSRPPLSTGAPGPAAGAVGPAIGVDASVPRQAASVKPVSEWIAPFDMDGAGPAPNGANWGRCALHFTPHGQPGLDAMRLGLMCGPSNGMRRVTVNVRRPDGGGRLELGFRAVAGDCFRLVVVGGAGVSGIQLGLLDAQGHTVAKQSGSRRWTLLGLDGPVCVDRAGRYRADIRAERGPLAVELWRLR